MKTQRYLQRLLIHGVLLVGGVAMMYPLLFALAVSFMTEAEYSQVSWLPLPRHLYLGNYFQLFAGAGNIWLWAFNTLFRIAWYIIVPGATSILGGYVFARLRFRGRNLVFIFLLSALLLPGIVFQVPSYVMLARWPLAGGNNLFGLGGSGFINEWPALLIPGLVNSYYIFFFRQSFYAIPIDYEEAARVDGATTFQILRLIYLPMLGPAIAVMVIFQSVALWNDYVWPWIAVGGNPNVWPVALGFQQIMASSYKVPGVGIANYPFLLTVAMVASMPPVILFLFLQRYFVEGVQGFGIKG